MNILDQLEFLLGDEQYQDTTEDIQARYEEVPSDDGGYSLQKIPQEQLEYIEGLPVELTPLGDTPVVTGRPLPISPREKAGYRGDVSFDPLNPEGFQMASENLVEDKVVVHDKGDKIVDKSDLMWSAVTKAETGSEKDPWIRVHDRNAPKEGSSAFGPAQITRDLMVRYQDEKYKDLFEPHEAKFLDKMIEQGNKFLKHGRMKGKLDGYNPIYEYGGKGDLIKTDRDKKLYKSVVQKIMKQHLVENNGDIEKAIKEWRYGKKDMNRKYDDRYYKIVSDYLGVPMFSGPSH